MTPKIFGISVALLFGLATSGNSMAAEAAGTPGTKVAYQPAPSSAGSPSQGLETNELIFSAAPRGNAEESNQAYGPLAEYLSKAIGKKVTYRYPGTWGVYQGNMQKGVYDLMYDGPHFNGWRVDKMQNRVLVKIPNDLVFVILVRKDNDKINTLQQLAGRTVCAHSPPNFGTLTLLNQFDNPSRLPVIKVTKGWQTIYDNMVSGKCVGGLIPKAVWEKNDKNGTVTKLLYKTKQMPNQAFSVGPRVSKEDAAKIAKALIAPEAAAYTESIRKEFGAQALVAASAEEYAGLGEVLKNEWGFN